MALIYVLWISLLLTAIAFQMAYRGHLRAQVTATTGETTQAHYLARAGMEMAIADLAENHASALEQHMLRQESEQNYKNVELGDGGAYTLFSHMDTTRNMHFGMMDECAKLNVKTADLAVLERLGVLENGLANAIVALREEDDPYDLNTLLLIEGVDELQLHGEDQNGNGLLDGNEDDGEESWPPDNADGVLNRGWSEFLTTWSAALDVDADGEARINLNDEDAEDIAGATEDISMQQADSIVHHRDKNELKSVLDLLDVKLIEKVKKTGDSKTQGENPRPQVAKPDQAQGKPESSSGDQKPEDDKKNPKETDKDTPEKDEEKPEKEKKDNSDYEIKETGKNAFTQEDVLKIADLLTVHEDEFLPGLININTAPPEVLACLPGVDDALAQAIASEADNRPDGFLSATDLLEVQGIDMNLLKKIYNQVSVRSDVYTVRSFGVLNNRTTVACVSAVLDRTGSEITIRYWREHD
jgi:DNA uptake protein ComE-like DNA-binding protein